MDNKSVQFELTNDPTSVRMMLQDIIDKLLGPERKPKSREQALVITKLQEARFWMGEDMMKN